MYKYKMLRRLKRPSLIDLGVLVLIILTLHIWKTYFCVPCMSEVSTNAGQVSNTKSNPTRRDTTIKITTLKPTKASTKTTKNAVPKKNRKTKRRVRKTEICPSDTHPGKYEMDPLDLNPNQTKLILFWNPPADWNDNFEKCEYKTCVITFDKCQFSQSHAVLFHLSGLSVKRIPKKIPGQVWILLNYEPPERTRVNLNKWNNMFNWTWSYRRDSDLSFPYFEIARKDRVGNKKFSGILEKKSKTATWYVSHCSTESKREKYVKEMQKYVDIDIYGKCGPLKCPYDGAKCYNMLSTVYKFYLGFENSLCQDYITEKAFAYMTEDVVLVIRGGYQKDLYLPPNSYIDTAKFSSAKKLTDYLQKLSRNSQKYEKFLNWKNHYEITRKSYQGLCSLCERLHDPVRYQRLYSNIHRWTNTKNGKYICDKNPRDF